MQTRRALYPAHTTACPPAGDEKPPEWRNIAQQLEKQILEWVEGCALLGVTGGWEGAHAVRVPHAWLHAGGPTYSMHVAMQVSYNFHVDLQHAETMWEQQKNAFGRMWLKSMRDG
jgi:hypothetical protein